MPNDTKQTNNNQQTTDITQTGLNTTDQQSTPPVLSVEEVVPPMPQVGLPPKDELLPESIKVEETKQEESGSAAPSDDIKLPPVVIGTTPKKKFGSGKVIATILGLFLLVGGLGAGTMLVQQNQNIQEQAGCFSDCIAIPGNTAGECNNACGLSYSNPDRCGNGDCDSGENVNNCRIDCYTEPDEDGGGGGPVQPICTPGSTRSRSCQYQSGATNCNGTMTEVCSSNGMVWNAQSACRDIVGDSCGEIKTTTGCGPNDTNAMMGYCTNITLDENCIGGRITCGTGQYCHCQGGVTCSVGVCVNSTSFETACNGDGRVVASNPINPNAKTCCDDGYVAGPNGIGCVLPSTGGGGGTPPGGTTPPTTPAITASCQNVKAYSTNNWTLLTPAVLSTLRTGDSVNFCVAGVATGGSFNKAKFTINGVVQPETTTVRPSSTDFCQLYVIPAGVTTFNVTAQINHVTLGWK